MTEPDRCMHCGMAYAGTRSRPVRLVETEGLERLGGGIAGRFAGTMHTDCSRLYIGRGGYEREAARARRADAGEG